MRGVTPDNVGERRSAIKLTEQSDTPGIAGDPVGRLGSTATGPPRTFITENAGARSNVESSI